MAKITNIEWLNQNSNRNYPFREDLSLTPVNQPDFILPNYVIVDFVMTMPASEGIRVYLSSMLVVGSFVTFVFSDQLGNVVSSYVVNTNDHTSYQGYNLVGTTSQYEDVRGRFIIGDLTRFDNDVVDGEYTFSLDTAEIEPCAIRPSLRGVRSLTLQSGTIDSVPISGAVTLQAGDNARLSYDETTNTITFSAVSPASGSYNEPCECNDYLNPPSIKYINGINAENVVFIGDGNCIEVTTEGNKIKIINTCSQPCCDCVELEFVQSTINLLNDNISKLENYHARLKEQLDTFIANAMLSNDAVP